MSRSIEVRGGARRVTALVALAAALAGCGPPARWNPPLRWPDDREPAPEPAPRAYNHVVDSFEKQMVEPLERRLDLARQSRAVAGRPKQAFNADAFDEVADSAWFTNRNAVAPVALAELQRGPDTCAGPDTAHTWTVVRAKTEGVTPGFAIEDARGDRYFVKFDPKAQPEMASGADVVSTKLFWAAGYHVPEDYIAVFDPRRLQLGKSVRFTDARGTTRAMTPADLEGLLGYAERRPDGRIRVLASRVVPGKALGPFAYRGTRGDDPNDLIPHQHRRELRGLRVMAAWLHHFDTKDGNSLDVWVNDGGKRYIRHYLLDFSSTLGSGSDHAVGPHVGTQNAVDPSDSFRRLLALGAHVEPWERLRPTPYPALGFFESSTFDPHGYEFYIPNPAFENCTGRDGFWGAKLVMSFTDAQIETAVRTGQYSDPEAARYLARTLIERRDRTGRYWFGRVNPLDALTVSQDGEHAALRWKDLAVAHGFEAAARTRYRVELHADGRRMQPALEGAEPRFAAFPTSGTMPPQIELRIRTSRDGGAHWGRPLRAYLNRDPGAPAGWRLVGIERED